MGYEYDDYEEDYEEDCEEETENVKGEIGEHGLKIEFNMTRFANEIVSEVVHQVQGSVKENVLTEIREQVITDELKKTVLVETHAVVKEIIDEFISTEKIQVGGGWDEETKEYTLKEFAKECIRSAIKEGEFRVVTSVEKNRYGGGWRTNTETRTFEEYIQSQLGLGNEIKKYIDQQICDVRDSVNAGVKDLFNESTKTLLSDSILKVLSANDTYKKIEENISSIANRREK